MASGQPSALTRMLQTTIAIDSTNATISSQVTGAPQTTKRRRAAARRPRAAPFNGARRASCDEDLVGLDHAELEARLLLDHLEAFLEVADLGRELVVALARGVVGRLLRGELPLQLDHARHAALAEPELGTGRARAGRARPSVIQRMRDRVGRGCA